MRSTFPARGVEIHYDVDEARPDDLVGEVDAVRRLGESCFVRHGVISISDPVR
jgi:hypothetical protein